MRPAYLAHDIELLSKLDRKIFPPADLLRFECWQKYRSFFIAVDCVTVGFTTMAHDMEFSEVQEGGKSCSRSLYLRATGIFPEFQCIGELVKQWQIRYARRNDFLKISTNCRKSNLPSLGLNQKFGFKIVAEFPDYYKDPEEAAISLERVF